MGKALCCLGQEDESEPAFHGAEPIDAGIQYVADLEGRLEDFLRAVTAAGEELEGMSYPEEASSLHEDLLAFYAYRVGVVNERGEREGIDAGPEKAM